MSRDSFVGRSAVDRRGTGGRCACSRASRTAEHGHLAGDRSINTGAGTMADVDQASAGQATARCGDRIPPTATISIRGMHKWFGDFHVLKDINLEVSRGERIVICGPSGSGKSTLIRCINRLEEHQQGTIVVDGTELTSDLKNIEIIRSEVGMVFQHFNLFPHLTALENCTLAPIWVRKMPKADAEEVGHALPRARADPRAGGQVPRSALGRPAAAGRDRAIALHESAHHALRRADLRARSGDDQGGAGGHGGARRERHDHAGGHP